MTDNRTNLEYEREECSGMARFLGVFAIPVVLLALLSACAISDPIERLQVEAWAEPYERRVGDWTAAPEGDCKMRALWLKKELREKGYDPVALVGYRDAMWPGVLHMVVVVDGRVIDADGVHDLADYLKGWREGPEWYDWRIAAAAAGETR